MPLIDSGEGHLEVPGVGETSVESLHHFVRRQTIAGLRVARHTVGVEEPSPGYAL
jgi:hypothetical protein